MLGFDVVLNVVKLNFNHQTIFEKFHGVVQKVLKLGLIKVNKQVMSFFKSISNLTLSI